MDKQKKNKSFLIAIISVVGVFVIVLLAYLYIRINFSWNEKYISNFLSEGVVIDTIYSINEFKNGDGVIILGRGSSEPENEYIYFTYFEGHFPSHQLKLTESRSLLNLKNSNFRAVNNVGWIHTPSYKDQDIYYNLYLNPTTDTLKVNGEEVQVEKIPIELEGKSYTLGFWYKLFPKDTVVTVE